MANNRKDGKNIRTIFYILGGGLMAAYQDTLLKGNGRDVGSFHHGRRTFGYITGQTNQDQTHWYAEAKRTLYAYVLQLPKGIQVFVYQIKNELGLSEQMIDKLLFVDNFKDGNPCKIEVIRSKKGWRRVYRV